MSKRHDEESFWDRKTADTSIPPKKGESELPPLGRFDVDARPRPRDFDSAVGAVKPGTAPKAGEGGGDSAVPREAVVGGAGGDDVPDSPGMFVVTRGEVFPAVATAVVMEDGRVVARYAQSVETSVGFSAEPGAPPKPSDEGTVFAGYGPVACVHCRAPVEPVRQWWKFPACYACLPPPPLPLPIEPRELRSNLVKVLNRLAAVACDEADAAVDVFLQDSHFNEWGVPDREVPSCPQCVGELWVEDDDEWRQVSCGACGFKRAHTVPETDERVAVRGTE